MISSIPDIDIYMLYFLDIKSIMRLATISKDQYVLISNLVFIKDWCKIHCVHNVIDIAAGFGLISIIKWIDESTNDFIYSSEAIDTASKNGYVWILEWFNNSGYEFKYTCYAIDWACLYGHISILDWFDKSKYEFKYSKGAIDWG